MLLDVSLASSLSFFFLAGPDSENILSSRSMREDYSPWNLEMVRFRIMLSTAKVYGWVVVDELRRFHHAERAGFVITSWLFYLRGVAITFLIWKRESPGFMVQLGSGNERVGKCVIHHCNWTRAVEIDIFEVWIACLHIPDASSSSLSVSFFPLHPRSTYTRLTIHTWSLLGASHSFKPTSNPSHSTNHIALQTQSISNRQNAIQSPRTCLRHNGIRRIGRRVSNLPPVYRYPV